MKKQKTTRIIVISGSVGAGKSTVAARLSELLAYAPVLTFDDYEAYVEWPKDMNQWVQDGADPSGIRVPKLKDDLLLLLNGESIEYPVEDKIVNPAEYIILEEPSGRERQEIGELIDLVIFIDTPQDICVMRMIQRVMDMKSWLSKGTFGNESKEDLVCQLDAVAMWINQYQQARSMYMDVSRVVKRNADVVVDGMKPVNEITSEILSVLGGKFGDFN